MEEVMAFFSPTLASSQNLSVSILCRLFPDQFYDEKQSRYKSHYKTVAFFFLWLDLYQIAGKKMRDGQGKSQPVQKFNSDCQSENLTHQPAHPQTHIHPLKASSSIHHDHPRRRSTAHHTIRPSLFAASKAQKAQSREPNLGRRAEMDSLAPGRPEVAGHRRLANGPGRLGAEALGRLRAHGSAAQRELCIG